jgi:hypothetical protein
MDSWIYFSTALFTARYLINATPCRETMLQIKIIQFVSAASYYSGEIYNTYYSGEIYNT